MSNLIDGSRYSITAVKKALDILDLFDGCDHGLSLAELSRVSGLKKSSVLRILYTLRESDYVTYDDRTKTYSLGIKLYRLGMSKFDSLEARNIAKGYLQQLSSEMGMICYMGVREGDKIAIIEQAIPNTIPIWAQLMVRPGGYQDLYSTGIGRLFLALESDQEVMTYLERVDLQKHTESSIVDKEGIMALICEAREKKYSGNQGENEEFIFSVCAPVLGYAGKMIAGISLCGIKEMFFGEKYEMCVRKICETGMKISSELGFKP